MNEAQNIEWKTLRRSFGEVSEKIGEDLENNFTVLADEYDLFIDFVA